MKRTTPKQKSDAFLEPIVKAALARRGTKKQLAEALSRRTGESVPRERVERWLKTDPAKRQQPLLGSGLLLMEEFGKMVEVDLAKAITDVVNRQIRAIKKITKRQETNKHGNRDT